MFTLLFILLQFTFCLTLQKVTKEQIFDVLKKQNPDTNILIARKDMGKFDKDIPTYDPKTICLSRDKKNYRVMNGNTAQLIRQDDY
jgi:hypothetical protein